MIKVSDPRVVIATTTYNMANTIYRTYLSILKQTYTNYYWLIIDNGSTDETAQIVTEIQEENKIEVSYVKKEHGVRASAINVAYDNAKGDYICFVDADDELCDNAIEKFVEVYQGMNKSYREQCWCVTANCIDDEKGEVVGKKFPPNVNEIDSLSVLMNNTYGEKLGMQNLKIVSKYRFPIFEGADYVSETILWLQLTEKYHNYYVNFDARIYHHDNDNCYTGKAMTTIRAYSFYRSSMYVVNNIFTSPKYKWRYKFKEIIRINYYGSMAEILLKNLVKDLINFKNKLLLILTWPISVMFCFYKKLGN